MNDQPLTNEALSGVLQVATRDIRYAGDAHVRRALSCVPSIIAELRALRATVADARVQVEGLQEQLDGRDPSKGCWKWGPDIKRQVRRLWEMLGMEVPETLVLIDVMPWLKRRLATVARLPCDCNGERIAAGMEVQYKGGCACFEVQGVRPLKVKLGRDWVFADACEIVKEPADPECQCTDCRTAGDGPGDEFCERCGEPFPPPGPKAETIPCKCGCDVYRTRCPYCGIGSWVEYPAQEQPDAKE